MSKSNPFNPLRMMWLPSDCTNPAEIDWSPLTEEREAVLRGNIMATIKAAGKDNHTKEVTV